MTTQLSTAIAVTAPLAPEQGRRSIWAEGAWADWARLLIASASRILLLAIVGSLLWTAVPSAFGWKGTTVMSDSMAPGIRSGDVVVAMPVDDATIAAALGKVILFDDPDHAGRLRLHRFVGTTDAGAMITRGDANPANDSTPISIDAVEGIAVLRAPFVGLPMLWIADAQWMLVAAAGVALLGLLALSGIDAHLRRERDEPDRIRPRRRTPRQRGRIAVGAVSAVVVSMLVVGNGAHAAFAAANPAPTSNFTTQSTFDCFTPTPADSPYFYYRFSESSGTTTADSTTNARTATLQSGVTRTIGNCIAGNSPSVVLNGSTTTGAITTSTTAIAGPNTYSLEAWFKTSSTTGGKIIGFGNASTGASGTYDRHIFLSNTGQVVFGAYNITTQTIVSAAGFNNGAWHHVVATMDYGNLGMGTGMKLYVDKVLVGSNTNTGSQSYTGYWRIGYDNLASWGTTTPTSYAFTGSLDNVAVYTTALTAAQVTAHFTVGH